jgi:DNA (cytosine-5)-methyltransferase 1
VTLTFGSLFAGVGGFDLGMEAAGWECAWQVEWDQQCQQVLARHWPEVRRFGDVCSVRGGRVSAIVHDREGHGGVDCESIVRATAGNAVGSADDRYQNTLPPVDLITFGSPCQDLSVAGKRAGLDGSRSGLFFEAIRIIQEMRDDTNGRYPRFAVWENVVGALSSNHGHDFAAALDSLAEIGALDIAWRVLDARWFGVPQRRRRIFVVADFGGELARALLAEPASVRRDSRPSGTTWPEAAASTGGSVAVGFSENQRGELVTHDYAHQLTTGGGKPGQGYPAVMTVNALDQQRGGADDNSAQAGHLVVCGGDSELGWQSGRVPNGAGGALGDRP